MKPTVARSIGSVALFAALATAAQAHPGHDGHELTWDFQSGVLHPITGWDHLLALLAVGWWSSQLGGRARWTAVMVFLGVLGGAALCGRAVVPVSMIEQGLAASVLALGILVASAAQLPRAVSAVAVGCFALFHGLAHAAEAPVHASLGGHALGFLLGSAFLLGAGFVVGSCFRRVGRWPQQVAGAAIAVVGLLMIAG